MLPGFLFHRVLSRAGAAAPRIRTLGAKRGESTPPKESHGSTEEPFEEGSTTDSPRADRADRSAEEVAALDRAKGRVLIGLLNDLRTPLMMIKTPVGSGGEISANVAATILDSANRIQKGLERAVKILAMDLEEDAGDVVPTDIALAVDRFVASLRPLAERHGITIEYTSNVKRAMVDVPWPHLEQTFESITERVVGWTAYGGTVRFMLSTPQTKDGRQALLEISTVGEVEEPGTDDLDPAAFGVAVSRRSIARYGGELTFEGTSCRLILPVRSDLDADVMAEDRPAVGPPRTESAAEGEKQTTVLIVDDHAGTRAYLRYALRKYHRIVEASDGKEALEVVREIQPDLVLSDIMMPVMDGNELCRAIKSDDALNHIPVFLVTANSMPTLKTEGLESGADDYLVKPFDVEEAVMRINNEIKTRGQLRRRYSREVVIKPSDITVTPEDEAFLNRAREIVEDNMENGNFSVQDLASNMGLSSRQLQRRLRETVDQSPVEFIRLLRLQRAAQLLEGRYGNVSEVAYSVGFTSLSYFAKCFKDQYGESPSTFKVK